MTKVTPAEKELIERIKRAYPLSESETVLRAYSLAKRAHEGQLRMSGEPFFIHPCHVASILMDLGMDAATVSAGFLHDVIEDTDVSQESLREMFGEEITLLVDGVTKVPSRLFPNRTQADAANYRKMLLAIVKDIRVVIIKLADRLHNMRTLAFMPVRSQISKAKETLDIYVPLAERLGMYDIKSELEDISMQYLYPREYSEIAELVAKRQEECKEFVDDIKKELGAELSKRGVDGEITGRIKSYYGIYKKMQRYNNDFDQAPDIFAICVVVNTIAECYDVLGVVNSRWVNIGRLKDYIALPKENGYRSLHVTVVDKKLKPFEIQIRTREMHRFAEYGLAAHWKYKGDKTEYDIDKTIQWIRSFFSDHVKNGEHRADDLDMMKSDTHSEEVLVFTPQGNLKNLPVDSTIVDFAYAIHSDVGDRCVGGRINGIEVPLSTKLKTGEIVEVITNPDAQPSLELLLYAASPSTRAKIRRSFKRTACDDHSLVERDVLKDSDGSFTTIYIFATSDQVIQEIIRSFGELNIQIHHASKIIDNNKNVEIEIILNRPGEDDFTIIKEKLLQIKTIRSVIRG